MPLVSAVKRSERNVQAVTRRMTSVMTGVSLAVISGGIMAHHALARPQSDLVVQIAGLKYPKGRICLQVFSGAKGFPYQKTGNNGRIGKCVAIAQNSQTVTFNQMVPGHYAIAAFHDRNSDNKLNQGRLGIPTEGFGFSNNPPLRFGPASFDDAKFKVTGAQTTIRIQMVYLN